MAKLVYGTAARLITTAAGAATRASALKPQDSPYGNSTRWAAGWPVAPGRTQIRQLSPGRVQRDGVTGYPLSRYTPPQQLLRRYVLHRRVLLGCRPAATPVADPAQAGR